MLVLKMMNMKKEENLDVTDFLQNKVIDESEIIRRIESIMEKYKGKYKSDFVEKSKKIIIDRIKKWYKTIKATKNEQVFKFGDLGWFREVILGKKTSNNISNITLLNEVYEEIFDFLNFPGKYKEVAGGIISFFVRNLKGLPKDNINNLDLSYADIDHISSGDLPKIIGRLTITNCDNLKNIELPYNVKNEMSGNVCELKIANCSKLEGIKFPARVGSSYIGGCDNLLYVDFANTEIVDRFSSFEIEECEKIKEIKNLSPDLLKCAIDNDIAFLNCPALEIKKLPSSVKSLYVKGKIGLIDGTENEIENKNVNIEEADFINCNGLIKNLHCEEKLFFIENGFDEIKGISCNGTIRFSNCNSLVCVEDISCGCECEFENCEKLKEIKFSGDVEKCYSFIPSKKCIKIKNCGELESILGESSEIEEISIKNCNKLNKISEKISMKKDKESKENIKLNIENCDNINILPSNLLKNPNIIEIHDCNSLCKIGELPGNLKEISIVGCRSLVELDLTKLDNKYLINRGIELRNNTSLANVNGIENIDNYKFDEKTVRVNIGNGNHLYKDLCSTIHNENINLLNNEYVGRKI